MTPRQIRLLEELRKNSRRSLTDIGMNTEIPLSSVFKMVRKLECDEIIEKHITLVDFGKIGYPLKVAIFIKTKHKEGMQDYLKDHPNLNTLLRISGDYNCYAEMLFKDMAEYQDFIDGLDDNEIVQKISTHFLTDVKQEVFKIGSEE